jgi:alpha-N-acetylglucosamine transferase
MSIDGRALRTALSLLLFALLFLVMLLLKSWHLQSSSSTTLSSMFPFNETNAIAFARQAHDNADERVNLNEFSHHFTNRTRIEQRRAFVTLLTNDAYVLAGAVLAQSLRRVNSSFPIVALLTSALFHDAVVLRQLGFAGFDYVLLVDPIANPAHSVRNGVASRVQAHKVDVFTKLRVFSLTAFEQLFFLDADCVVRHNIDHLLRDRRDVEFAFAPSLQPIDKCDGASQQHYRFAYKGANWCQSHSKELYHGTMDLKHHNAGAMLIKPSIAVFDELVRLMEAELTHADTCIGQAGCNDQRVINVYYHERPHATLELTYNIFCDQLLSLGWTMARFDPAVVHYRGGSKPWVLNNFRAPASQASGGTIAPTSVGLLRGVLLSSDGLAEARERFRTAAAGESMAIWESKDRCGSFVETVKTLFD